MKKILQRLLKFLLILVVVLVVTYLLGPRPAKPIINNKPISIDSDITNIEQYIAQQEAQFSTIKPDNEAKIVWVDSAQQQTEYCLVYLHGFSASRMEADPMHRDLAARYGMNLYMPRLYGHGLDTPDGFLDLTTENYLSSAKEALAVAKILGKKVIIMGTSTGCTLGLYLAGGDDAIEALLLYSPNIDLYDTNSNLLVGPWGRQLAQVVVGSHRTFEATDSIKKYWMNHYRTEGIIALKQTINATMTTETFKAVHQPTLLTYYYKDETHQDDVISVPKAQEMFQQLGTPNDKKQEIAFPEANTHVLTSKYHSSPTELLKVEIATQKFLENKVGLIPKD